MPPCWIPLLSASKNSGQEIGDDKEGEVQDEQNEGGEQEDADDEPASAVPVLATGPKFGGDREDKVGCEEKRPPRPAGMQELEVDIPEIVAGSDPIEKGQGRDATEERSDST